jgi:Flp pilus assembly protein TadB
MLLFIISFALFVLVIGGGWAWQQSRDQAQEEKEREILQGLLDDVEDDERAREQDKSRVPQPIEDAALRLKRSGLLRGQAREELLLTLDRKLMHAGINNPVEPGTPRSAADVISYYLLYAGGIILLALAFILLTSLPPLITIVWALAMLFFPYKLLTNKITKRQKAALFQLDKFLDELDLVLSNGRTTLDDAIASTVSYQHSARRKDPVLAREFDYALRQWTAGRDRSEALRDVSRRIGVFQISAVIENMVQSLEKGTPPRETVRSQSDQAKAMVTEALRQRIGAADTAFTVSMAMSLAGVTIILFGALILQIMQGAGSIV